MKITIEYDANIMKDGQPDIVVSMVQQQASSLDEILPLVKQCLQGAGYIISGELIIEDYDDGK